MDNPEALRQMKAFSKQVADCKSSGDFAQLLESSERKVVPAVKQVEGTWLDEQFQRLREQWKHHEEEFWMRTGPPTDKPQTMTSRYEPTPDEVKEESDRIQAEVTSREPVTPQELSYVMAQNFYGRSKPLELAQMVVDLVQPELKGQISDGYHCFDDLYQHRVELYLALCRIYKQFDVLKVWRSLLHSDGTGYEGWFVLGLGKEPGWQITYHLPTNRWEDANFAQTLPQAPPFDGHTAADVLERLKSL